MNNEYAKQFYKDNVEDRLPDCHCGMLITSAVGIDIDKNPIGIQYNSNMSLDIAKFILEHALEDVNKRLEKLKNDR